MVWTGQAVLLTRGFQVFSIEGKVENELKSRNSSREGTIVKISEEGVIFKSYRDGTKIELPQSQP